MAAFIASQREAHGIPHPVSCRALGVSQSWSWSWKDGELPPRAARRERLKAGIARLFAARGGRDGSPRIAAALRDAGASLHRLRARQHVIGQLERLIPSIPAGSAGPSSLSSVRRWQGRVLRDSPAYAQHFALHPDVLEVDGQQRPYFLLGAGPVAGADDPGRDALGAQQLPCTSSAASMIRTLRPSIRDR